MLSSESPSTTDRKPKWCTRCKCFHKWTPPWEETEAAIIAEMSQEIADQIDREVLAELLAQFGRPGESPLKDVLLMPVGIPSPPLRVVRAKVQ